MFDPWRGSDVHDTNVLVATDTPARRGCHAGATVARCDASGHGGCRCGHGVTDAIRLLLRAAWRDPRSLHATVGRRQFRVPADHETARAVPRSADGDQQP